MSFIIFWWTIWTKSKNTQFLFDSWGAITADWTGTFQYLARRIVRFEPRINARQLNIRPECWALSLANTKEGITLATFFSIIDQTDQFYHILTARPHLSWQWTPLLQHSPPPPPRHTVTRPRSQDTRHQSEMVITPPPVKWTLVTQSVTQSSEGRHQSSRVYSQYLEMQQGTKMECQHKDTLPNFLNF